ncbi:MBL fold metallo-hydrolase [Alicyclobacillus macrosporangiidus]|uniref:MBL fold metallo-hydrolase n=1 Tax=Alicyclobacillus macrosporangiidus TaxID=392015 RepID=UPI0034E95ED4
MNKSMRVTSFGNCVQLTFYPGVFPVNCYLVREDDGLTLIDTGLPSSAKAILAAAQRLDMPIQRIALTHAHGDHVGALDTLREALPDAEVMISARDARLLRGDTSIDPAEPQVGVRGSVKPCKTHPTRLLTAGDRIGSLEVISCPGHTPGHVAFLDARDRTLIAGDAFQTKGGVAVAGTVRPLFPFPALATWHRPTALNSAKHLRQLHPSHLAVGHGNILVDPLDAMDAAIQMAERKLKG